MADESVDRLNAVGVLTRREIEARILAPVREVRVVAGDRDGARRSDAIEELTEGVLGPGGSDFGDLYQFSQAVTKSVRCHPLLSARVQNSTNNQFVHSRQIAERDLVRTAPAAVFLVGAGGP
jgi:hypothetical protein